MAVDIFDAKYYSNLNPDLPAAGLTTEAQLLSHFQASGLSEGRTFSPYASLNYYRASNADLANLSNQQLFEHLQQYGIAEGRKFSPIVDLESYRTNNGDLAKLNNEQLFEHLRYYGIGEVRKFSSFFDLNIYRAYNGDLAKFSNFDLLSHFVNYGVNENRIFSNFFDIKYYRQSNPDLEKAGLKGIQSLEHFQNYGIFEGRKPNAALDVNYYRDLYPDLKNAGLNNKQLFEHFQYYGLAEGRIPSSAFNSKVYLANNPDLAAAGFNQQDAYNHYAFYGYTEGRPGSDYAGNSFAQARNVSANTTFIDFVGAGDSDDYYKIVLDNVSNLAVNLTNIGADLNLQLIQDKNNNGSVDDGEILAAGVKVGINPEEIKFDSAAKGTYYLRVFPGGNGSSNYDIKLDAKAIDKGEIRGRQQDDVNGDGVFSATEPGLADWTIYLDQNKNNVLDAGEVSTKTDASGNYAFTGLLAGSYTVSSLAKPGWKDTSKSSEVVLTINQIAQNINFGANAIPAIATNAGLTLNEGQAQNITQQLLLVNDIDNAQQLTYTLTNRPINGSLKLNGSALAENGTFTQGDINNNRLSYEHNGSETTADSFKFTVSDGAGNSISPTAFNITVKLVNDIPVISQIKEVKVQEGQTVNIDKGSLSVTDGDNKPTELTYTLAETPKNGSLRLNGTALAKTQKFTQEDINNNSLSYMHNGSETLTDSFTFTVSDGAGGTIGNTNFNIGVTSVNDLPAIANNKEIQVDEGKGIKITNEYLLTSDGDHLANQIFYNITSLPTNGILKLNDATLSANGTFTQEDINNERLSYEHNGSETVKDSFNFTVTDKTVKTPTSGGLNIAIEPVNDLPEVKVNTGITVEEGKEIDINETFLSTKDDDNSPNELTYKVSNGPSNGVLKLNGSPLTTNITFTQNDINNNRLSYEHNGSEIKTDTFSFTVSDKDGATSSSANFNINVTNVNDRPSLEINQAITVEEGKTLIITKDKLLTTDIDNTDLDITYTLERAPDRGSLKLNNVTLAQGEKFTQDDISNGRLSYEHDNSETLEDSFNFTVSDKAGGDLGNSNFNITVTPVNDIPEISLNEGVEVNEEETVTITGEFLQATDEDNIPIKLTYKLAETPTGGQLKLNGSILVKDGTFTQDDIDKNRLTYEHGGGETRTDSFSFTVSDTAGGTTSTDTFNITVKPVNDAPIISTSVASVNEERSLTISKDILSATDVDNDPLEVIFTIADLPKNGKLKLGNLDLESGKTFTQKDIEDRRLTYKHNGSETLSDSFNFTVTDGKADASTGSLNLTVNPVNDTPVIKTNQGVTVKEGDTITLKPTSLEATDADNEAIKLEYTVTKAPINGNLQLNGLTLEVNKTFTQDDIDNDRLSYEHNGSETRTDSFIFTLSDGAGGNLGTNSFSINITPSNDPPVIQNNTGTSVNEGGKVSIAQQLLSVSDSDNGARQLTYTLEDAPTKGSLRLNNVTLEKGRTFTQEDINNKLLSYEHDGSETVMDSFNFSVKDPTDGSISTTSFNIAVNPVNDAPAILKRTGATVAEGKTVIINKDALEAKDSDNTAVQLTYTLLSTPTNGSLKLNGSVVEVNKTFSQDDLDNNRLTYEHNGSETRTDSFTFVLSDGTRALPTTSFSINITPTNDAPTIQTNAIAGVDEGRTISITRNFLLATDPDNTPSQLTYTLINTPVSGKLKLNNVTLEKDRTFTQDDINNNRLSYEHNGDEKTSDSFEFTLKDASNEILGATTFNIAIKPINDAPAIANNKGVTVNEGSEVNITRNSLLTTDEDNTTTGIVYTLNSLPSNGKLKLGDSDLSANQTFTQSDINNNRLKYEHNGSETRTDSFNFSVSDGNVNLGTKSFSITVTPVNDPSLVKNEGVRVDEGKSIKISRTSLEATDIDTAPDQLVYTIAELPAYGNLKINGVVLKKDDSFTQDDINKSRIDYEHNGTDGQLSDSFKFSFKDGVDGTQQNGTFAIAVNPVNDPPKLSTNSELAIDLGKTLPFSETNLLAVDAETTDLTKLIYTLKTLPAHGILKLGDTQLGADGSFTQDDIKSGRVSYTHDGSSTDVDGFTFALSDGTDVVVSDFKIKITTVR